MSDDQQLIELFYRHWIINLARTLRHAIDDIPATNSMKHRYRENLDYARRIFDPELNRVRPTEEEWARITELYSAGRFLKQ